jgi:thiol-disulfide isomerase/thioredoxin
MKRIFTLITISIALAITSQAQIKFAVGATAPNFTVVDDHGTTQTLYQYTDAGKYVVLDLFAYWCGPCHSIAPIVDQFYKKYGCNAYDVAVLGIELEGTAAQLKQFDADCTPPLVNPYPACIGLAPGNGKAVHTLYGTAAYPTVCLIGPDRKIVKTDIWPLSAVKDLEAAFPAGKLTAHVCPAATGVEESISENNVTIYPSPAVSSITVDLDGAADITSLKVFNILGKNVIDQAVNKSSKYELNISKLESGIYLMEISTGKGLVVKKFMKN